MSGWGAALGAAGNALGAWAGARSADKDRNMQSDFAKQGIQWKVNDAKAAGIHPLYALGAQTHSFSPVGAGDVPGQLSEMGQNLGRAVSAGKSDYERNMEDLTLTKITSEIGETDARKAYYDALAAKANQERLQSSPVPGGTQTIDGQVTIVSPKQQARHPKDSSKIAGSHPLWQKTEVAPGVFLDLPASQGENPLESLEGMSPQALTFWKNAIYNPREAFKRKLYQSKEYRLLRGLGARYRQHKRTFQKSYR